MSNLNELQAKIEQINSQANALNKKREQNIGKRETLIKQCSDLCAEYEAEYGVRLTPETLEAEVKSVSEAKEKEVQMLSQAIAAINSGDYATAYMVLGIEPKDAPIPQAETPSASAEVAEQAVVNNAQKVAPTPTEVVQNAEAVVSAPTMPSQAVVGGGVSVGVPSGFEPSAPSQPAFTANGGTASVSGVKPVSELLDASDDTVVAPPVAPPPSSVSEPPVEPKAPMSAMNGFTAPPVAPPVAPPTAPKTEKPATSAAPKSFAAMFGGTEFKPNN